MGIVFVFGNEYIQEDALAVNVAKHIEKQSQKNNKHTFYYSSRPESLLEVPGKEIIILDVARGISKVQMIDVSQLKNKPAATLHDFDLGFFLQLVAELEPDKKFKIIAIPQTGNVEEASKEVCALLEKV